MKNHGQLFCHPVAGSAKVRQRKKFLAACRVTWWDKDGGRTMVARCGTVNSEWETRKADVWEIRTGHLGNLKQLGGLQSGILGGICSPEPQSCVWCGNQPLFKCAAKMQYRQFKVGKWESRHVKN
jgi:hypothetical protein